MNIYGLLRGMERCLRFLKILRNGSEQGRRKMK